MANQGNRDGEQIQELVKQVGDFHAFHGGIDSNCFDSNCFIQEILKGILSNKKKLQKKAVVGMSEGALTCVVLYKVIPPKLKDSGSFTIPCIVGGFVVGHVLCDLGLSFNLMPYSLCKRLNR